ncbi:MAG: hypothetical protein F4X11_03155 [Acidobacteria bacterium]|nr:hypothetical protein [Acidobacteriota bacterium]
MTRDDFLVLATLGTARVKYRKKHSHIYRTEGRAVLLHGTKPCVEVTKLIPIEYWPGVELIDVIDPTMTKPPHGMERLVHYETRSVYLDECAMARLVMEHAKDVDLPLPTTDVLGDVTCPLCRWEHIPRPQASDVSDDVW